MAQSAFFDGILPNDALNDLRQSAPENADTYLNSLILLAAMSHLPNSVLGGSDRQAVLQAIGGGLVAAARAVEQERWGGRPVLFRADVAQWDGLHSEMQAIAGNSVSQGDGHAVQDGMLVETGRRFQIEAFALATGGLFAFIGAAARTPIRLTPDILDEAGRFLGQKNAGDYSPRFSTWLAKPDNLVEIMPSGQVRYTTSITAPASTLNGRSVSVSYADGVPDFSQLGVARVDIPNPVGRGAGADKADMEAASRALWAEIEAGRVDRRLFTEEQLSEISLGEAKIPGLTWHHNGTVLNPDGTGSMLLLDEWAHRVFGHVGWASKINE